MPWSVGGGLAHCITFLICPHAVQDVCKLGTGYTAAAKACLSMLFCSRCQCPMHKCGGDSRPCIQWHSWQTCCNSSFLLHLTLRSQVSQIFADSGVALKCQPWTEFSPALEGPTRPALLPAKSQSSVAVRFDSGVLVVTSSDGRINHSAFVPGVLSMQFSVLIKRIPCLTLASVIMPAKCQTCEPN